MGIEMVERTALRMVEMLDLLKETLWDKLKEMMKVHTMVD